MGTERLPVELVDERDAWIDAACFAVRDCAHQFEQFTADDVWAKLAEVRLPGEPRWMGAAFRWACDMRLIVRTKDTRKSSRPECHHRPMAVWRSLVFAAAKLMSDEGQARTFDP